MNCPYCARRLDAVGGFHAIGGPVGHAPQSFGTKGEHYVQTHHCPTVNLYVAACTDCWLVAIADSQDLAITRIGGYWR